jgi:predicted MFS family arabinose efflux permease
MEIFVGVGYALGAPAGGFIFESSGFFVVFLSVSIALAVSSITLFFLLPAEYYRNPAAGKNAKTMCQLLADPRVLMDIFIGLFGMSVLAMLEPVAQIHITDNYPDVSPG